MLRIDAQLDVQISPVQYAEPVAQAVVAPISDVPTPVRHVPDRVTANRLRS